MQMFPLIRLQRSHADRVIDTALGKTGHADIDKFPNLWYAAKSCFFLQSAEADIVCVDAVSTARLLCIDAVSTAESSSFV